MKDHNFWRGRVVFSIGNVTIFNGRQGSPDVIVDAVGYFGCGGGLQAARGKEPQGHQGGGDRHRHQHHADPGDLEQ
jgi:hypothetical protein